jgi:hypothetical protein
VWIYRIVPLAIHPTPVSNPRPFVFQVINIIVPRLHTVVGIIVPELHTDIARSSHNI